MLESAEDWKKELFGFIENYKFPCVAAWDGFHVEFATKLKNHYSFKKWYTINNMGLVSYNKRFLSLTVNAPGSTRDARLLRHAEVYKKIVEGEYIPERSLDLGGNIGEIPLVTVGDSAFPRYTWLLKCFSDTTRDPKEVYYNRMLRSARVGNRKLLRNAKRTLAPYWQTL